VQRLLAPAAYVFAVQFVHASLPIVDLKVPGGHARHCSCERLAQVMFVLELALLTTSLVLFPSDTALNAVALSLRA
jgi:hypothetical protein